MGLVVSGLLYGVLFGLILVFNIVDDFGWRRELIIVVMMYIFGVFVMLFVFNFVIVVFGRLIFGIGIGLLMYVVLMYIVEIVLSLI